MLKRKKAFTLVELLVVLAIIAVLATLSVVNFQNAIRKSRDAKQKSDIVSVQQALVMYRSEKGSYPDVAYYVNLNDSTYLVPGFISAGSFPTPASGSYTYTGTTCSSGKCKGFTLCTAKLEAPDASGANADDAVGTNIDSCTACKYFCVTNP